MEIKVKYNIGDIVEHIHATTKYLIIGYEYIDGYGITYIGIEPEKAERKYLYGCEVKKYDEKTIGFISFIEEPDENISKASDQSSRE